MRNILNAPGPSFGGGISAPPAIGTDISVGFLQHDVTGFRFVGLAGLRRKVAVSNSYKAIAEFAGRMGGTGIMMMLCGMLVLIPLQMKALTSVHLNILTAPSSGATGSSFVNVSGAGFPSGTILPGAVTLSLSTSCGGPGATVAPVTSVTHILGSSDRLQFKIPESLDDGTYFISISGATTDGDTFVSSNCSEVQVTHSFVECNSSGAMSVVVTGNNVTAYVPSSSGFTLSTGINVVPIEGNGSPATIATPGIVSTCSSNSVTGETVCVARDNPDVYEITGTTLDRTLQSSARPPSLSLNGPWCVNCAAAINPLTNTAVITMDLPGPSGYGIQLLDLGSNTFAPAVPTADVGSPQLAVDPARNLILRESNPSTYTLFHITSTGTITEYGNFVPPRGPIELNHVAVDCSTGIAVSTLTGGFSFLYMADLTQAIFTPPSGGSTAGTWTAPQQLAEIVGLNYDHSGTGISIASGTSHLGLLAEGFTIFGLGSPVNDFAVIQLPSTSGSLSLVDYAIAEMPPPSNYAIFLPSSLTNITTYTSPNDGRVYGINAGQLAISGASSRSAAGVINMQRMLDAPRMPGTHQVDPAYDLIAHGVVRYVVP